MPRYWNNYKNYKYLYALMYKDRGIVKCVSCDLKYIQVADYWIRLLLNAMQGPITEHGYGTDWQTDEIQSKITFTLGFFVYLKVRQHTL